LEILFADMRSRAKPIRSRIIVIIYFFRFLL
jgi:hypothetical protein